MLTVQSLLDELGLELAAGARAAESPVRWVHISELEDPTPWLSGGELMLTTGIPFDNAAKQRAFVRRLADHNLSGLGFGTGFSHAKLPKALVDEATKRDFPLFEIPYSTPFIAITEKAFARLVNEQYEVLQRGIAVQRRLERLVLEERGLEEIVATIASAVGGTVAILNGRGERLAGRGFRRQLSSDAATAIREEALSHTGDGHAFVPAHPAVAGRALAHPVISPGGGPPQAWVVIVRDSGGLGDFERLILQQAVAVVALELMRRRVARETERRLAGDVLAGALGGRLDPSELRRRLEPFGIGEEAAVLVFSLDDPAAAEPVLERALAADACPAVVAPHTAGGRELLCAVIDAADRDPLEVAADARKALVRDRGAVRAAASRPAPPEQLRRSFHEARCALEATAFDNGHTPEVASWRDLGAFTLLLSIQDDDALKLYCDSVLGPIEEGDEEYGGELLRSLEAFIEQNGQWERAARQVYCHRHTLRYRMRKVEELTGRDLSRAHDRIEFWLALRARELRHMKIGVPKEIKPDEYRVAITPAGVREMVDHGHEVSIEAGAGEGSAIADADFEAQGAGIVPDAATVFAEAEMVLKVKEPQPVEIEMLRPGQLLFTYLHLAPDPEQTRGLQASGATCVAYETVEDTHGRLPLLAPMSEIAGKLATQAGAFMLEKPLGGRGILLGGVPGVAAANVIVIGGGVVGMNAAFIAIGMEADVFVFDKSIDRLRDLEVAFGGRCSTVYSTTLAIEEMLPRADLVIGAVLVHGARAPYVITRDQLGLMQPGAVLVDVAIDQGGCFETSRPTTHHEPTFEVDGIIHYCVANMPGAVPITATRALTNATLPYATSLADHGLAGAIEKVPGLRPGVNIAAGKVTHQAVAEAVGEEYVPLEQALNIDNPPDEGGSDE